MYLVKVRVDEAEVEVDEAGVGESSGGHGCSLDCGWR